MGYPAKSANLRSIVINNIQYRWRFSTGDTQSALVVYGPVSGRQSLSVVLLGWRDLWLACPEPTDNQPKIVGPDFVRQAIEFGLANGWQPEQAGRAIQILWASGQFSTA
jgi:hypothetical protein